MYLPIIRHYLVCGGFQLMSFIMSHIPHVGLSHRGQQPPTSQGELHEIASRVLNLYIDSDWKMKILN
jgi:hypothetical protein